VIKKLITRQLYSQQKLKCCEACKVRTSDILFRYWKG